MLQGIFGVTKPIIGMLHLGKIPLNKKSSSEYDETIKRAREDIKALQEGGIDGICIENWEVEAKGPFLEPDETETLKEIIEVAQEEIIVPSGINVLHNDYRAAFALAKEFDLKFVWLDVFVDRVRTDFSHSEVSFFDVIVNTKDVQKHKALSGDIPLWVQVHPKHYKPIDEYGNEIAEEERPPIENQAKRAIKEGADAIVITKSTGIAPTLEPVWKVKNALGSKFPVLVGSGVNSENIRAFLSRADGVIVGTSLKTENFEQVVKRKVKDLMRVVRKIRK